MAAPEQRYSPLDADQHRDNVKDLGLAWYADLDTNRGQEATPIVVDGVLYVSTAWSKVMAWTPRPARRCGPYDPKVPDMGRACLLRCGQPRRGRVGRARSSSAPSTAG
jgi:glucose dehydrogenase